jgi:hypothetical protein
MKFDDETIFKSLPSIIRHENIILVEHVWRNNKRSGAGRLIKAFQLFTSGFASPWTTQTSCASWPEVMKRNRKQIEYFMDYQRSFYETTFACVLSRWFSEKRWMKLGWSIYERGRGEIGLTNFGSNCLKLDLDSSPQITVKLARSLSMKKTIFSRTEFCTNDQQTKIFVDRFFLLLIVCFRSQKFM